MGPAAPDRVAGSTWREDRSIWSNPRSMRIPPWAVMQEAAVREGEADRAQPGRTARTPPATRRREVWAGSGATVVDGRAGARGGQGGAAGAAGHGEGGGLYLAGGTLTMTGGDIQDNGARGGRGGWGGQGGGGGTGGIGGDISGSVIVQAVQLVILSPPPASINAGTAFGLAIAVEDGQGNVDTAFNGPITIVITDDTGDATLEGTRTLDATTGVARFAGLSTPQDGTFARHGGHQRGDHVGPRVSHLPPRGRGTRPTAFASPDGRRRGESRLAISFRLFRCPIGLGRQLADRRRFEDRDADRQDQQAHAKERDAIISSARAPRTLPGCRAGLTPSRRFAGTSVADRRLPPRTTRRESRAGFSGGLPAILIVSMGGR